MSTFLERPSIPPPERPIRHIDAMKKQQSLENLTEDKVVSPTKVYPDLTPLVKSLSENSSKNESTSPEHNQQNDKEIAEQTKVTNNGHAGRDLCESSRGIEVEQEPIVLANNGQESNESYELAASVDQKAMTFSDNDELEDDDLVTVREQTSPEVQSSPDLSPPEFSPPDKPPRQSSPVMSKKHHALVDSNANTFVLSHPNRKSADADLGEGKIRPPRPVPPATKPRFASLSEASHL
jgi:hypothetical protein